MTIQENFIGLMIDVMNTNSPEKRLNALYEFFRIEPEFLTQNQQTALIDLYKSARDEKAKSGRNDATKRWDRAKKDLETTKTGWLCIKSPYGKKCAGGCDTRYEIDDIVFVNRETKKGYHAACVPPDAKNDSTAMAHFERLMKEESK